MKIKSKKLSDSRVEITVTLDSEDLKPAREKALEKLAKEIHVEGFLHQSQCSGHPPLIEAGNHGLFYKCYYSNASRQTRKDKGDRVSGKTV